MIDQTGQNSLYPTHSCFTDAMELMDYTAMNEPEVLPAWRIVHAICEMPDGTRYAHAWVEDNNLHVAVFAGILNGEKVYMLAQIFDYEHHLKVIESTKYTVKEAAFNNINSGHFGPWEKKYQALSNREGNQRTHMVQDGRPLACHRLGPLPKKEKK
jgi:hypothetical protein